MKAKDAEFKAIDAEFHKLKVSFQNQAHELEAKKQELLQVSFVLFSHAGKSWDCFEGPEP